MIEPKNPWQKSTQVLAGLFTTGLVAMLRPSPSAIIAAVSILYIGYALGRCLLKMGRPGMRYAGTKTSEFKALGVAQALVLIGGFCGPKDLAALFLAANACAYILARGLTKHESKTVMTKAQAVVPPEHRTDK